MSHPKKVDFNLGDFLRVRHPIKTAEAVAALGVAPVETVRGWLKGYAKPTGAATLALIGAYGPEYLAAALPGLSWLAQAKRAERMAALERRAADLRQDLENFDAGMAGDGMGRRGGGLGGHGAGRVLGRREGAESGAVLPRSIARGDDVGASVGGQG